jgi:pyruvate dehydrogenase (quinone)
MDSLLPLGILLALGIDGPALVQIITDPPALSMPPTLTGQQLRGFALALRTVVLNGGAGEVVQLARSNLRSIPRPRRSI